MAVLGMILPSMILVLLLLRLVGMVKDNPRIISMLKGLRPVVVAMLAYAAYGMVPSSADGAARERPRGRTRCFLILTREYQKIGGLV
jgi:chromate transporter